MLRIAVCLALGLMTVGRAYAPIMTIDPQELGTLPWPELTGPAQRSEEFLDDLLATPPGQEKPDEEALALQQRWQKEVARRKRHALSVADAAQEHEEAGEFSEALTLYEKLWVLFSEQRELIGRIKRDHALDEIKIDLSTPEEAFVSLKRALMTYKLTAPTFGITAPDNIVYQWRAVELHKTEELEEARDIPEDQT